MEAAHAARLAAQDLVFQSRTAKELKSIFQWGDGLPGSQAARQLLNDQRMAIIRGKSSIEEVSNIRHMYNAATASGRAGDVAIDRAIAPAR